MRLMVLHDHADNAGKIRMCRCTDQIRVLLSTNAGDCRVDIKRPMLFMAIRGDVSR